MPCTKIGIDEVLRDADIECASWAFPCLCIAHGVLLVSHLKIKLFVCF